MPRPKGNRDDRVNIRCNNKHKGILEKLVYEKREELELKELDIENLERYNKNKKGFEEVREMVKNSLIGGIENIKIRKYSPCLSFAKEEVEKMSLEEKKDYSKELINTWEKSIEEVTKERDLK